MFSAKEDNTVSREQVKRLRALIEEYEQVKTKKHPTIAFVGDLFKIYRIKKQNFYKYYHRYQAEQQDKDKALLPAKRGAKYRLSKFSDTLQSKIIALRHDGFNRYEIYEALVELYNLERVSTEPIPCPSSIYNILKRNNLNRLKPKQQRNRRMIIKERAGELGHFDCYHLPREGLGVVTPKCYEVSALLARVTARYGRRLQGQALPCRRYRRLHKIGMG
ncbi:hypothetical protein FACS1894103_6720 [Campylobacterota bacterium]|nr:hypothetical protein FACS1894103_6720 [Campylobacterota bacterium]